MRLKWKLGSVRLEIVVILTQDRCMVCTEHPSGSKIVLVMRLKWKLDLVCLEMVPIVVQDRCTVYTKWTIGSEIVLDAPDGTPK
jgi:hypothetical protein